MFTAQSFARFVRLVRTFGAPELASEEAACAAFAAARWPKGTIPCPGCGAPCVRRLAELTCAGRKPHRFTVFVQTPLGTKRRPNVRATLLAIRAMTTTATSVSARALAREVGMNHVTLWRHMHSLRAALPAVKRWWREPVVDQTIRTWINGTFHGVRRAWRHRYLQEITARWAIGDVLIASVLNAFLYRSLPIRLVDARAAPGHRQKRTGRGA